MYRESIFKGELDEKHVKDVLHVPPLLINTMYNLAFRKAFTSDYEKYSEICSNDIIRRMHIPFRLQRYDLARRALLTPVPVHQDYNYIQPRMIVQLHRDFRKKFVSCAKKQHERSSHMSMQRILIYLTSISETQKPTRIRRNK